MVTSLVEPQNVLELGWTTTQWNEQVFYALHTISLRRWICCGVLMYMVVKLNVARPTVCVYVGCCVFKLAWLGC